MNQACLWPVCGQHDEVGFLFCPDRKAAKVIDALGLEAPPGRVLLTNGYAAYDHYATMTGVRHAQCWSHLRRKFFEARDYEPKRAVRQTQSAPRVREFFA